MSDLVTGMLIILVYGAFMFTWIFVLFDVFARRDVSFLMKAVWVLAVVFLPIIGILIYFVFRPRHVDWWAPDDNMYAQPVDTRYRQIQEIETLVRLRNEGTITDDEYARMKDRVMTANV